MCKVHRPVAAFAPCVGTRVPIKFTYFHWMMFVLRLACDVLWRCVKKSVFVCSISVLVTWCDMSLQGHVRLVREALGFCNVWDSSGPPFFRWWVVAQPFVPPFHSVPYTWCPGGECARLRETVPCVKVHRSNPKHLYPKLKGYGDNGERKVWSSCGSTYCTYLACCSPYTAHVRPSVWQPSQAHSAFFINRFYSYSEV